MCNEYCWSYYYVYKANEIENGFIVIYNLFGFSVFTKTKTIVEGFIGTEKGIEEIT